MSRPTAAQNTFWRKWRAHDPAAPERFSEGRYKCPAHADTGRSMKLSYRDNRVDVTCFDAGCGKQAILDRLGVRRVDLDDYGPAAGGKPVGVFAYHDERGVEVLRAHRYVEPVGVRYELFRDGGWEWAPAARGPHVLYRLPEVLAAIEAEERVFVVDSEQAADALREAGVVATTAAYRPPGKPWRPEYTERLHGAYCTVVARRHEAGRKHGRNLAGMLLDAGAADVQLVEPATAKTGADAADHLAAGFGLDDFAPLFVEGSASASGVVEGGASIAAIPVAMEAGADLLADVERFLGRFVVFATPAQGIAATLFVAHTWAFDAAEVTPYLHVTSAEKRSGKTLLLELLRLLARGPRMAADMSPAALFRSIGNPPPTILFDEVQELFGRSVDDTQRELRAVLNAGYRLGGNVTRCVGEGGSITVADFPVFCPKVLAGTGKLPDMLADRSVPIRLKRKPRDATVERFRRRDAEAGAALLCRRLAGWAETALPALTDARPELPDELHDRQQDCWEPLLAIADAAGGDWPKRARAAAVELHGGEVQDESVGVLLLGHIRERFELSDEVDEDGKRKPLPEPHGRLTTEALLRSLVERDDGPWGDWWGDAVEAAKLKGPGVRLANLLRPYGVAPKRMRFDDGSSERGYERAAFSEPWALYCTGDGTDGTSQVRGHIQHGTSTEHVPTPKPALTSNVPSVPSESAEPRLVSG